MTSECQNCCISGEQMSDFSHSKQDCLSVEGKLPACVYMYIHLCSYNLDFHSVTWILDLELDIMKMYLHIDPIEELISVRQSEFILWYCASEGEVRVYRAISKQR